MNIDTSPNSVKISIFYFYFYFHYSLFRVFIFALQICLVLFLYIRRHCWIVFLDNVAQQISIKALIFDLGFCLFGSLLWCMKIEGKMLEELSIKSGAEFVHQI